MRYSRIISNYSERITLFDPTYMISIADLMAISMKTLRIDSGCYLEKEYNELIYINP